MPTVTVLARAHLNHSPHDAIRIELVEHLETPAAVRVSRVKKLAGFRVVQRWGWSGWRGRDGLPAAGSRTAPRVVGWC